MKKIFKAFFIVTILGLLIGYYSHSKTKPAWEILWNVELNPKFDNDLKFFSGFYKIIKVSDNEIQLMDLINETISNFNNKKYEFNSLKLIEINLTTMRYKTDDFEKSSDDAKLYLQLLNKEISENINNILLYYIDRLTIKLNQDYNTRVSELEALLQFLKENNLTIFNYSKFKIENKSNEILSNNFLDRELSVNINTLEDLSNLINGYKKEEFRNSTINKNEILNNYKNIYESSRENYNYLTLLNIENSINRQPNKLFMIIASIIFLNIIVMLYFGLKKNIIQILKNLK